MVRMVQESVAKAGGRASVRWLFVTLALVAASAVALPATIGPTTDPQVIVREEGGVYHVSATFAVAEPMSVAIATLTDYGQIPRFMPDMRTSQVLERRDDVVVVEQEAIARFMMFSKRVHLVLDVQEGRGAIHFRDRCGKSFTTYEGVWRFAQRGELTEITYHLVADPSFDVPEFLLKRLFKRDAANMIERLKAEITARARTQ
jgi:ribosome-associated toxin RatA of RatAB toxin-antitoxin module